MEDHYESVQGPDPAQRLVVGQLRRQTKLGSEAVYRVCDVGEDLVQVEVVRAPGLPPRQRFVFAREAVRAMELLPGEA